MLDKISKARNEEVVDSLLEANSINFHLCWTLTYKFVLLRASETKRKEAIILAVSHHNIFYKLGLRCIFNRAFFFVSILLWTKVCTTNGTHNRTHSSHYFTKPPGPSTLWRSTKQFCLCHCHCFVTVVTGLTIVWPLSGWLTSEEKVNKVVEYLE